MNSNSHGIDATPKDVSTRYNSQKGTARGANYNTRQKYRQAASEEVIGGDKSTPTDQLGVTMLITSQHQQSEELLPQMDSDTINLTRNVAGQKPRAHTIKQANTQQITMLRHSADPSTKLKPALSLKVKQILVDGKKHSVVTANDQRVFSGEKLIMQPQLYPSVVVQNDISASFNKNETSYVDVTTMQLKSDLINENGAGDTSNMRVQSLRVSGLMEREDEEDGDENNKPDLDSMIFVRQEKDDGVTFHTVGGENSPFIQQAMSMNDGASRSQTEHQTIPDEVIRPPEVKGVIDCRGQTMQHHLQDLQSVKSGEQHPSGRPTIEAKEVGTFVATRTNQHMYDISDEQEIVLTHDDSMVKESEYSPMKGARFANKKQSNRLFKGRNHDLRKSNPNQVIATQTSNSLIPSFLNTKSVSQMMPSKTMKMRPYSNYATVKNKFTQGVPKRDNRRKAMKFSTNKNLCSTGVLQSPSQQFQNNGDPHQRRPASVEEKDRIERIKTNLLLLNQIMQVDQQGYYDHQGDVYLPLPNHNYVQGGKLSTSAAPAKADHYQITAARKLQQNQQRRPNRTTFESLQGHPNQTDEEKMRKLSINFQSVGVKMRSDFFKMTKAQDYLTQLQSENLLEDDTIEESQTDAVHVTVSRNSQTSAPRVNSTIKMADIGAKDLELNKLVSDEIKTNPQHSQLGFLGSSISEDVLTNTVVGAVDLADKIAQAQAQTSKITQQASKHILSINEAALETFNAEQAPPMTQHVPENRHHVFEFSKIGESNYNEQASVVTKSLNKQDSYQMQSTFDLADKDASELAREFAKNVIPCYSGASFAVSQNPSPQPILVEQQTSAHTVTNKVQVMDYTTTTTAPPKANNANDARNEKSQSNPFIKIEQKNTSEVKQEVDNSSEELIEIASFNGESAPPPHTQESKTKPLQGERRQIDLIRAENNHNFAIESQETQDKRTVFQLDEDFTMPAAVERHRIPINSLPESPMTKKYKDSEMVGSSSKEGFKSFSHKKPQQPNIYSIDKLKDSNGKMKGVDNQQDYFEAYNQNDMYRTEKHEPSSAAISGFDEHKSTLKLTPSTSQFKGIDDHQGRAQMVAGGSTEKTKIAIMQLYQSSQSNLQQDSIEEGNTDQTPIFNQRSSDDKIREELNSRNYTLSSKIIDSYNTDYVKIDEHQHMLSIQEKQGKQPRTKVFNSMGIEVKVVDSNAMSSLGEYNDENSKHQTLLKSDKCSVEQQTSTLEKPQSSTMNRRSGRKPVMKSSHPISASLIHRLKQNQSRQQSLGTPYVNNQLRQSGNSSLLNTRRLPFGPLEDCLDVRSSLKSPESRTVFSNAKMPIYRGVKTATKGASTITMVSQKGGQSRNKKNKKQFVLQFNDFLAKQRTVGQGMQVVGQHYKQGAMASAALYESNKSHGRRGGPSRMSDSSTAGAGHKSEIFPSQRSQVSQSSQKQQFLLAAADSRNNYEGASVNLADYGNIINDAEQVKSVSQDIDPMQQYKTLPLKNRNKTMSNFFNKHLGTVENVGLKQPLATDKKQYMQSTQQNFRVTTAPSLSGATTSPTKHQPGSSLGGTTTFHNDLQSNLRSTGRVLTANHAARKNAMFHRNKMLQRQKVTVGKTNNFDHNFILSSNEAAMTQQQSGEASLVRAGTSQAMFPAQNNSKGSALMPGASSQQALMSQTHSANFHPAQSKQQRSQLFKSDAFASTLSTDSRQQCQTAGTTENNNVRTLHSAHANRIFHRGTSHGSGAVDIQKVGSSHLLYSVPIDRVTEDEGGLMSRCILTKTVNQFTSVMGKNTIQSGCAVITPENYYMNSRRVDEVVSESGEVSRMKNTYSDVVNV